MIIPEGTIQLSPDVPQKRQCLLEVFKRNFSKSDWEFLMFKIGKRQGSIAMIIVYRERVEVTF
nr:hypothetical protein [Ectobacillus panaciterrae]